MAQSLPQTIVLITGANRGIGRSLAETYLSRPSHTLIAFIRDTASETSQSLLTHPSATNSNVVLVPYDASKTDSAPAAISRLSQEHPEITHLDLVISNAGFNDYGGPSLGADAECYLSHYMVNALSHLLLFDAVVPFLRKAPTQPSKFVAISSATGSIKLVGSTNMRFDTTGKPRGGALPYTSSKCALNHMMTKLDLEYPDIVVGLFTPGPTRTGFGSGRFNWDTIPNAMDVETVVEGLIKQFDEVKKASGKEGDMFALKDWKGDVIPW